MFNKLYVKLKKFLKENYRLIIFFVIMLAIFHIPFPYYINAPGGLIDISKKIEIEDSYEVEGSLNLAYVSEIRATIPTLLYALIQKDWDIIKQEEITYENESMDDVYFRDRLLLEEANQNAIIVGYQNANKNVTIKERSLYVTYVDPSAKTDLKIGDQIITIAREKIEKKTDLSTFISHLSIGEEVEITVIRDKKQVKRTATMIGENQAPKIGIMVSEQKVIETEPKIDLHFRSSESGPSGGLMMSLAIYNYLTEQDLTDGRVIVGTGTIDETGKVGSIGGVAYKLKGAVKKHADLFLVPIGENYEEAINLQKKYDYNIKIVGIDTFYDAVKTLQNKR